MASVIPNELGNISYLVQNAVDFHCHGVGHFDFTEINEIDLDAIEMLLSQRKQQVILTFYLPIQNFEHFIHLMEVFNSGKQNGKFKHIKGFGLEGPLLASHGGTPEKGVWMPEYSHWKELAACGSKGLIYIILSPDAYLPGSNFSYNTKSPPITWITETLLEGGVLPAPGHFIKNDPYASAKLLQSIFDIASAWGKGPMITDHLFNDMPHVFKHAWRTPEEKTKRNEEIKLLNLEAWSLKTLEQDLGPVPAAMIKNAREGIVKICQNFDGEHVDLAIVKKTIELVGAHNMLLMTDSIESKKLAGRDLYLKNDSTLLYQDQDIVAAGSQGILSQIEKMISIGLSNSDIELITRGVPFDVLTCRDRYIQEMLHAETDCI